MAETPTSKIYIFTWPGRESNWKLPAPEAHEITIFDKIIIDIINSIKYFLFNIGKRVTKK